MSEQKRPSHTLLYILLFVFGVALLFSLFSGSSGPPIREITVTELYRAIEEGKVAEMNINSGRVIGTFVTGERFGTYVADSSNLEKKAVEKGVKVTAKPEQSSPFWGFLAILAVYILPNVIFVAFFIWLIRRQRQGSVPYEDKSRISVERPNVTFQDIAGLEEVKEEIMEIIDFFRKPGKYIRLGAKVPRGVLLVGAPGNGKTLLAKAAAREAQVPFLSMNGSDFVELFVGNGARHVRELFGTAKRVSPCIVFIDELDAVLGRRTQRDFNEEYHQTVNAILSEMDGFSSDEYVIVIAATNQPEILDPAALRPGRFDRKIIVPSPDVRAREGILKIHSRGKPLAKDVSLAEVARGTPGLSGADLAAIVNEATLLAIRRNQDEVTKRDFNDAIDKVLLGPERKQVISKREKEVTAFHEGGHALVAVLLEDKGADPLRKVTIIPRGPAGGATWTMPDEDRHIKTKEVLLAELAFAMGGRAAEILKFSEESSGARADFQSATEIARAMVCEYGMSDKVGKEVFVTRAEFLGFVSSNLNCSEATKQLIDSEVKKLLDDSYNQALQLLKDNQGKLEALANALLEKETLDGKEVMEIIASA